MGAFSKDQVEAMLKAGVIAGETLAWAPGLAGWKPLMEILGPTTPPPPARGGTSGHGSQGAPKVAHATTHETVATVGVPPIIESPKMANNAGVSREANRLPSDTELGFWCILAWIGAIIFIGAFVSVSTNARRDGALHREAGTSVQGDIQPDPVAVNQMAHAITGGPALLLLIAAIRGMARQATAKVLQKRQWSIRSFARDVYLPAIWGTIWRSGIPVLLSATFYAFAFDRPDAKVQAFATTVALCIFAIPFTLDRPLWYKSGIALLATAAQPTPASKAGVPTLPMAVAPAVGSPPRGTIRWALGLSVAFAVLATMAVTCVGIISLGRANNGGISVKADGESRPPPSLHDLQPEEIWERVAPSVVRVEAKLLEGGTVVGSGFVCEFDGKKVVLSNRHVVVGAKEVRVGASTEKLLRSPKYRISPEFDLALIDLPAEMQVPLLKTRAKGARIGERVFAIGFPLGLNKSITQGLVSSETENLVQFDAPISSGNSGGPLVDKEGAVLGVVTAGSTSRGNEIAQNLNFAIKMSFVPKAELFQEPIVRFYDAWRELVGVENKLIEDLQDRRVFEVRKCVEAELSLALLPVMDQESARMYSTNRSQIDRLFKTLYADKQARVVQRYGSLNAGVTNVVAFLRSKISQLDRVPQIFVGIGSDDLLRNFGHDRRRKSLYDWDIKPSEIVPLLKVSVEFAKAKYEDAAYKIEFSSQMLGRIRSGDTNIVALLMRADAKWIGERTTVRLPYNILGPRSADEDRVRLWFLCDQKYGHRSSGPWLKHDPTLEKRSLTEQIQEWGGFEEWITSMLFGKLAAEQLEAGDVDGAIESVMNEVELRRYAELDYLAFLYACRGDFEKAYQLKGRAYLETFEAVDPFELKRGRSLAARMYLLSGFTDDRSDPYPDSIKRNLRAWTRFVSKTSAFALTEPILDPRSRDLTEAEKKTWKTALNARLSSPQFSALNEFEKCWVLDSQMRSADLDGLHNDFEQTARTNTATSDFFHKYFEGPDSD